MADLADFYPLILPDVLGCPEPSIDAAIVRVARDFCRRSMCWEQDLDAIPLAESWSEYDIDLPADAELVVLQWVKRNGIPIGPVSSVANLIDGGATYGYRIEELARLILMPAPTNLQTPDVLTLRATLRPTANATSIAQIVFDEWAEDIAYGAKAMLKRQPRKTWSDPQGAGFDLADFERGVLRARGRALAGHVKGGLKAKAVTFGGRR